MFSLPYYKPGGGGQYRISVKTHLKLKSHEILSNHFAMLVLCKISKWLSNWVISWGQTGFHKICVSGEFGMDILLNSPLVITIDKLGQYYTNWGTSQVISRHDIDLWSLVCCSFWKVIINLWDLLNIEKWYEIQILIYVYSNAIQMIAMAKCKTAVSPLLMHWRYCSLAPTHRVGSLINMISYNMKLPTVWLL